MTGRPQLQEGDRPVRELWSELSASMRMLRTSSGMSLRQAELASGRARGTLSQVENGKARPSRELVDWYDATFGGDGLLLSIYAEARGAHGRSGQRHIEVVRTAPGDELRVEEPLLPFGSLVAAGSVVAAGWTFVNAGSVPWADRRLQRVGAHAAVRLVASAAYTPIPDCAPGSRVAVVVELTVPPIAATFAAYWRVVDADGLPCYDESTPIAVVVAAMP